MKENLRLRKELEEMKKENDFLKKAEVLSVTHRHNSGYRKGTSNKVLANLVNRNFIAPSPDKIWWTDFTFMYPCQTAV